MSQITTHVLDTSSGKPAKGIEITLFQSESQGWKEIAKGITNTDGRISDLIKVAEALKKGVYKMKFEVSEYFQQNKQQHFYPYVEIVFEINSEEHYHIPLLLNPFGYTTYRGS